jgi:hypothetical protein
MNLQKELRHKSEDIDNSVLLDVVKALRRRVRAVSHDYDIPYIAGYSIDGKTIFIDRHLPRTIRWLLKTVRVEPFLLTHEIVEKALLDELRLHYLHAHQIAVRAERDAVKAAGVSWWAYQSFMKKHEKQIEEEKLIRFHGRWTSSHTAMKRISGSWSGSVPILSHRVYRANRTRQ